MILAAAIPLALHERPEQIANIGFGSGLTTSTFLASDRVKRIDTVEIERAMVQGARHFLPRVERAYLDGRSQIHIEDAKAFFATRGRQYDVIVSEPSNPWVSGVSSLFSEEFYRLIRRYLATDGLLVQWMQSYELDVRTLSTVMLALGRSFDDYVLYALNDADLLIVAKSGGKIGRLNPAWFSEPGLRPELERIGIRRIDDLKMRQIGNKSVIAPLFSSYGMPVNSDFFPVLDIHAARDRFRRTRSTIGALLQDYPAVLEMLDGTSRFSGSESGSVEDRYALATAIRVAREGTDYLTGSLANPKELQASTVYAFDTARSLASTCKDEARARIALGSVREVSELLGAFAPGSRQSAIWKPLRDGPCAGRLKADERLWLEFRHAVAIRDAESVVRSGGGLSENRERPVTPEDARFLGLHFAAALVGTGNASEAKEILARFGPHMGLQPNDVTDLAYRLVLGNAVSKK